MKWNKLSTFFVLLPFIIAPILALNGFQIDARETLNMFLSLVWGILISLGGSLFFLSNLDFNKQKKNQRFMVTVSNGIKSVTVAILLHTIVFIFLSFLYPIRRYFISLIPTRFIESGLLASSYHSFLYVELILPSLASVIVAIWCILLVVNQGRN